MVQNSLGRLWMLNNPASPLRDEMDYYIEPDAEHEDFIKISGPEDISLCDPACGSGHILVYAFELLAKMYLERGYREREIPELVLSKNLHGMEIDPRAAQIARLALAMCARGMDRRFFGRGVRADVAVLAPVALEEGDVPRGSVLAKKKDLVDALAHLDEVGSLLAPGEGDLAAIREAIDLTGADGLFGSNSKDKLQRALATCETLARRYDCVVANPPYMGSSSFGPFMSKWVKKNYPDVKSDLFSSFVVRMFNLAKDHGECGVMSPFVWMFIGSYEKLRNEIIDNRTLTSLIQLEYSGFAGATVPICTYTFHNSFIKGYKGGYVRLSDFVGASVQAPKALEAIGNPDCGWFYRRDAETFKQIPGTPIAYWASDGLLDAFANSPKLKDIAKPRVGLQTSDNARFIRLWHECSLRRTLFNCPNAVSSFESEAKWYPHNKGGSFRRWFGNAGYLIEYKSNGESLRHSEGASVIPDEIAFNRALTYSRISSGLISFREQPTGWLFDSAAVVMYPDKAMFNYLLALLNSNVISSATSFLVPTLNAQPGDIAKLPILTDESRLSTVSQLSKSCREIAGLDWDSFETSWDFKRNPLV